jgi:hypothetical protein
MFTRHSILTLRFIHAHRSRVGHAKTDPVLMQVCEEDGFTEGGKLVQFAIAQYTAVSTCDTACHECGQSIEAKEQRELGVPVKPIPKRAKAYSWTYISSNSYSDIGPTALSHGVPSYSSAGSKSSNCPECNACDSIHQGCCQVCGYERPRNPIPSSNSYSDIGPTALSHGVPSYSSAGSKSSNCPACNACDSIHQGCCQVCGYERPRNPTPLRRAWQHPSVTPKQPLWVPFKHVKDQQEIAFAMSELKFRYLLCLLVYVQ